MNFKNLLGKKLLFFDGAMGTMLQNAGLTPGEIPEYWNIEHPEKIFDIHKKYLEAGANIVETNTFGAHPIKLENPKYTVEEIIKGAVSTAKKAVQVHIDETGNDEHFVALSVGPIGKLLSPLGEVSFDDAYNGFKTLMETGEKAGADIILIETMTDLYEIKSAVLAAKENTNLPIIVSVMLDDNGKLLTGADIRTINTLLEGLGVNAVGLNCGFGPKQISRFIKEYLSVTNLPLMVNPNAGMPSVDDRGNTVWNLTPTEFANQVSKFANSGAFMLGGCCGTTPEHISELIKAATNIKHPSIERKKNIFVSAPTHSIELGKSFTVIGEKINPTGNKEFKAALKDNNKNYAVKLAMEQANAGAHIIDVNVGLPEIDEENMLVDIIREIQAVVNTPLMIDTANYKAMEKAVRYYNGIPFINSVSGKTSSLNNILPICAKYGGMLIALTLDDNGIPKTAKERVQIALKIISEAEKYGISKDRIIVDPLTLTVSADATSPFVTLETIWQLKQLSIRTSIGVSNVSFGLPAREKITSTFLAMAMSAGLSAAIMNPFSDDMMNTYFSYMALMNKDNNCQNYINRFENANYNSNTTNSNEYTLQDAIISGLKDEAYKCTVKLSETLKPLDIVNNHIIPALDIVGSKYEKGILYLPQLLMSAEAAQESFTVIKNIFKKDETDDTFSKGKIVLATVKGDVHDIGKNIVKVLLENYGYTVIDLGKDVDVDLIVQTAIDEQVSLVGLSALMTTTVPNMAKTIKKLHAQYPQCKVAVGGAVLNKSYADTIEADFYCKDAMATVKCAEQLYNC